MYKYCIFIWREDRRRYVNRYRGTLEELKRHYLEPLSPKLKDKRFHIRPDYEYNRLYNKEYLEKEDNKLSE